MTCSHPLQGLVIEKFLNWFRYDYLMSKEKATILKDIADSYREKIPTSGKLTPEQIMEGNKMIEEMEQHLD